MFTYFYSSNQLSLFNIIVSVIDCGMQIFFPFTVVSLIHRSDEIKSSPNGLSSIDNECTSIKSNITKSILITDNVHYRS